jgi:hypothetical protein
LANLVNTLVENITLCFQIFLFASDVPVQFCIILI